MKPHCAMYIYATGCSHFECLHDMYTVYTTLLYGSIYDREDASRISCALILDCAGFADIADTLH